MAVTLELTMMMMVSLWKITHANVADAVMDNLTSAKQLDALSWMILALKRAQLMEVELLTELPTKMTVTLVGV